MAKPTFITLLVVLTLAAGDAAASGEGAPGQGGSGQSAPVQPAQHKCDPVTDDGWTLVPERQVIESEDGKPYRSGSDWVVDRTLTVLPYCHYYNSIGVYSLRSYSLAPVTTTEQAILCRREAAVPPYTGSCPPR